MLSCDNCYLFKGANQATVDSILSRSRILPIKFESNQSVALSGDDYERVIIILKGSLSAEMRGINGKTVRIETLPAGSAVATAVLFSSDPVLPVCLTAIEETELLKLPMETVLELCSRDKSFLINYLKDMGDKVQFLAEKIRLFQFTTIRQKLIAHILNSRQRHNSDKFLLSFNRETLAEVMGVTRPSLSREFSNLANDQLIRVSGRELEILEMEQLKQEISD